MVGNLIYKKRTNLGLSREEFAKKLGVHYSYIALIETNKRKLSKTLLPKVAKVLNINIKELKQMNYIEKSKNYNAELKLATERLNIINLELADLETRKTILLEDKKVWCNKISVLKNVMEQLEEVDINVKQ